MMYVYECIISLWTSLHSANIHSYLILSLVIKVDELVEVGATHTGYVGIHASLYIRSSLCLVVNIKVSTVELPNKEHYWDKLLCPLLEGVPYIEVYNILQLHLMQSTILEHNSSTTTYYSIV